MKNLRNVFAALLCTFGMNNAASAISGEKATAKKEATPAFPTSPTEV